MMEFQKQTIQTDKEKTDLMKEYVDYKIKLLNSLKRNWLSIELLLKQDY